jgi:putative tricarboxylic transport membrane protein
VQVGGSSSRAGLAIGLGLIAIAAIIGLDTSQMQVPPTYARVGPQIFPVVITIGLTLAGAALVWNALRGRADGDEFSAHEETDWKAVALIGAGLIAHMNLLKPLGFVPAGIALFMCVAFAFGSRHYARDLAIGAGLVLAAYIGFTRGLGLQSPPGILHGLI